MEQRITDFGYIVGRDTGRHADRNAGRAVAKQIWKVRRQDDRLRAFPVIGVAEVDGVFVNAFQQTARNLRHPRLGVAHGRRIVAVDIAEITLPVDQGIADREVLC